MEMIKEYLEEIVCFYYKKNDLILPFESWLENEVSPVIFNITNDLLTNGIAVIKDNKISIANDDLFLIEKEDFEVLSFPKYYPFEIYINLKGAGLKDLKNTLTYSFQDKTYGNGSGNIIFKNTDRKGALVENQKLSFLLDNKERNIIFLIDKFNQEHEQNVNKRMSSIAEVQYLASKSSQIFVSKILTDTTILSPKGCKLSVEKLGEDKFRLVPIFEGVNQEVFDKKFNVLSRIKEEYSYTENGNKVRVLINDTEDEESGDSIKTELHKLKLKNFYSKKEINDIVDAPSKYWNTDLLSLDDFGDRVVELGVYQPKFYPFISPYKSEWLPGIAIEDKINGTRLISISDKEELDELTTLFETAKAKNLKEITYKNEVLAVDNIQSVIDVAKKQLENPKTPVVKKEGEQVKKVLIIKDNTEIEEYSENVKTITDAAYSLYEVSNLSKGIALKEHQKEGVAWLQTLSQKPYSLSGVLLADDMGLGKTIQVLYFMEWFVQNGNTKPNLVIAPVSLLENWDNEYKKFFKNSNLDVITLWGKNVKNYIHLNDKELTLKSLSKKGLYLTTYETLRRHQIPFGMINWGIVALDEVQRIKTPGTLVTNAAKALKAQFKIAMTGTPVENSLMDLWCIMDFCNPGLLLDAKSFSKEYQKPLKSTELNFEEHSTKLRNQIGEALMRRMKVDVAKDLPTIEYQVHKEVMSEIQYDKYVKELIKIEELKQGPNPGSAVLQGILNLKSIADHPYIKTHNVTEVDVEEVIETSAKLKKTIEIIDRIRTKQEKVIIFSENRAMQKILRKVFIAKYNTIPAIINGDTPSSSTGQKNAKLSRQQEVDRFQEIHGFNIIVMSPIAAGFGLNITGANHVIHYTRHWNPAKEQQATDRAYRIGQTKPVFVHYPLAVAPRDEIKTFDLILDQLLERKSTLASTTLFPSEKIEIKQEELAEIFKVPAYINAKKEKSWDKVKEGLLKLNSESFSNEVMNIVKESIPDLNKLFDNFYFSETNKTIYHVFKSIEKQNSQSIFELETLIKSKKREKGIICKGCIITNKDFLELTYELTQKLDITILTLDEISTLRKL